MRTRLLTLITLIAVATAAAGAADKRARLEEIRERISAIKEQIAEDREARSEQIAALEKIERRISKIVTRLDQLDSQIAHIKDKIDELAARAEQQRRQLDERMEQLAAQIRAAYRVGHQGRLQLILSQENPAVMGRMLGYYEYYAEAQSEAIAEVRAKLQALRETRQALSNKREQLQEKRAEREAILAQLKASRAERRATIAAIEARLAKRGERLDQLQANAERLEDLINSLEEGLAPLPDVDPDTPFVQRKGDLPPPVNGPVIAAFGDPKASSRLEWEGRWIGAPAGTPVEAVAPGRVVYVGWMYRYGLMVVLNHGDQFYTIYGHNQAVYVRAGEHVAAGEQIATVGKSGGHEKTGVYFEIRHGDNALDPGVWLRP